MTTLAEGPTPVANDALPRRLGLATATAVVVGEVIGVGIFLTPSEMAKSLASPLWLFATWAAAGLITVCGALCFGALAARHPEDGGPYVYLRRAFGGRVAFQYGWLSLLVTDPGITALMATGLATYAGALTPYPLAPIGLKLVAIGAILALAAINILGLRLGAGALHALSALKLLLLAGIVVLGFGFGPGSWSHFQPFAERPPDAGPLAPALVGGLLAAFFSLAGWWDAGKIAGEVRDPEKTLPRALMLGVGLVTLAYVAVGAVFWYLVPLAKVETARGFATQAGEALFGVAGGRIFSGIASHHSSVLSNSGSMSKTTPRKG